VPQPRVTWVSFGQKGKKVAKGDDKNGNITVGNKGVCTINKE
jgi:hypothetical protein